MKLTTIMLFRNQVIACLSESGEEMPESIESVQRSIADRTENLTGVIKARDDHWEMFHANGRWSRNFVL